MSEKYIKLLGPVFHNNKEYNAEAILIIPENITEEEAERLIKFKTAEYFTPIVIKTNTAETGKQPPVNSNKDIPPSEMNKAQCQEELENLGIKYSKKATLGELQQLISDHRDSLQQKLEDKEEGEKGGGEGEGEEGKDINSMTREKLESELTVRAISFNSDQSDDDLRKLLTDYEAETGGNDE